MAEMVLTCIVVWIIVAVSHNFVTTIFGAHAMVDPEAGDVNCVFLPICIP